MLAWYQGRKSDSAATDGAPPGRDRTGSSSRSERQGGGPASRLPALPASFAASQSALRHQKAPPGGQGPSPQPECFVRAQKGRLHGSGPSARSPAARREPRGPEGAPAGMRGFRPSPSRRGEGFEGGALRVEVSRPRASLAQTSFNFLACSARPDVPSELQLTELYWTRRSSSPQVERQRIARCPGPAGPGAWGLCAALELRDHTARSPSLASSTRRCVSSACTQCALAAVSRSLRGRHRGKDTENSRAEARRDTGRCCPLP
ncbi:uncharacterized protein LOC111542318 [Piliocolobus tephrosceles]|uniref:uncharacterized protein LOC111542318 n=1 Tax=Piliocolobus tephrosceles TaxID=591936 RepID=UPI000E6B206D|nr:uncharacterized protein LOC111542318 [Piliocolobus tephrosceles]